MNLRPLLLLGTSLGLLAISPIAANAQQGPQGAYRAYVAAQKSGDQGKIDAARKALEAACQASGAESVEACITDMNGKGRSNARERGGRQGAEHRGRPQAQQPKAAPQAKPEAPAAKPQPEKPAAKPQPKPKAPAAEPQKPKAAPAPEAKQLAPAPKPKAPPPKAAAPAPAPKAPAPKPPAPKPEAAKPANGAVQAVHAAANAYNKAVAAYGAVIAKKGDAGAARQQMDAAHTRLAAACAAAGSPSVEACAAKFKISIAKASAESPWANGANPWAKAPAAPAPAAKPKPPAANDQPVEARSQAPKAQPKPPAGQPAVPKEEIKQLPKGVSEGQVAPLFDSAKDHRGPGRRGDNERAGRGDNARPERGGRNGQPQGRPRPAPTSDANAQADIGPVKVPPVSTDQGKKIQAPPKLVLPQDVTIVQRGDDRRGRDEDRDGRRGRNGDERRDRGPDTNETSPFNFSVILNIGGHEQIRDRRQEHRRLLDNQRDQVFYEDLGHGNTRETIMRADGSRLVTTRNRYGDIIRRSRITADGHEYVLAYVDPRHRDQVNSYTDPAADLPPLQLDIPVRDYVMDARSERAAQIAQFLDQPPVEPIQRIYSIDEVKHSARLRDDVRRLEISDLTFATGSADLSVDQVDTLDNVAEAMQDLLRNNPAETFLIEGHTDAIGSDISNLELSDARAASVAEVLTDHYGIPPENLVTQGYGERFLKIQTDQAEALNRRVVVRRITPLVTPVANR